MQPVTVLSLFDGMSCGRLALERAWIPVRRYFASEIDKYAIQIATKNFPDIHQIGNAEWVEVYYNITCGKDSWYHIKSKIWDYRVWELGIDLLIGWSPCQWFSNAGKGLNFEDSRSKLFFEFVRILNEAKPRYFLLENVKMKKEWQNTISEHLFGIQPVEIDSALLSAQRRKRLYWVGKRNEDWSYTKVDISQPKDRWILLWDILEDVVDNSYNLSEKVIERLKSYWYESLIRAASENSKSYSLTTSQGWHREPKVVFNTNPSWRWMNWCVYDWERKSPTLTVGKWEWVKILQRLRWWLKDYGGETHQENNFIKDSVRIRKLTPIECERLQTLPDNYTEWVSNTQRYKMIGNGWTVDVIAHIFREIFKD